MNFDVVDGGIGSSCDHSGIGYGVLGSGIILDGASNGCDCSGNGCGVLSSDTAIGSVDTASDGVTNYGCDGLLCGHSCIQAAGTYNQVSSVMRWVQEYQGALLIEISRALLFCLLKTQAVSEHRHVSHYLPGSLRRYAACISHTSFKASLFAQLVKLRN